MRNTMRHLGTLTTLLVAGLALHSNLAAQGVLLSAPTLSAPEQLEAQAHQPIMNGDRGWLTAARELENAAGLRAAGDAEAITDLITAGTLYQSVGRPNEALDALEHAGQRAEKAGENDLAARAYLGAFKLAAQVEDADVARTFLDRAVKVAQLRGVSMEEREAILPPVGIAVQSCN